MAIKTVIALEGAEEIIATLRKLGPAGEAALKQFQDAINNARFDRLEENLNKAKLGIGEFAKSVLNLKNIIAGTALGVFAKGLFDIAVSTADGTIELKRNADAVGVSEIKYQALSKAIKDAGGNQDQLTNALRRFASQVDAQGQEQLKTSVDITKGLAGSSTIVFKTVGDFQKLQDAAAKFAPIYQSLLLKAGDRRGLLPLTALSQEIVKIAQKTDEEGVKLRTELAKLGIDTPALSGTFEGLDKIVEKAKGTLSSLGITLVGLDGQIKQPEEVLIEFIRKVQEMGTNSEKAQAIIKVFGRAAGPELAEAIRTANLPEIEQQLKRLGIAFDPEKFAKAKEVQKAFNELGESAQNLKNQIGLLLARPTAASFDFLADIFRDTRLKIIEESREIPKRLAEIFDFVQPLQGSISRAAGILSQFFSGIWNTIKSDAQQAWSDIKSIFSVNPFDLSTWVNAFNIFFDTIANKARNIWNTIKGIFSTAPTSTSDIPSLGGAEAVGLAGGGLFRGRPGRDTNLAWLTDKEYVMRPEAVRYWGVDAMNAFNALKNPFKGFSMGGLVDGINRSFAIPAFAGGGLNVAPSGLSLAPVHLHLPSGDTINLLADEDGANQVIRYGRKRGRASGGRPPSWVR